MNKVITIGSATMDVFVECDEANIVSVCSMNKKSDFMSYPYGSKIDISSFASNVGGGGVNTARKFDKATDEAVRAFQEAEGMDVDGIVDYETWERLINLTHMMEYVF